MPRPILSLAVALAALGEVYGHLASPVSMDPSNQDIILPPAGPSAEDAPKLLIFIPGANVPTMNYNTTMHAIQTGAAKRGLGLSNMWIVVPAISTKKCIMFCPSTSLCSPLNYLVQNAVAKAVAQGYNGSLTSPDAFISGHSLGGVCADTLSRSYTNPPYVATVLMGAYPKSATGNGSMTSYPTPVLAIGAELDGGLGRIGKFAKLLQAADDAAKDIPEGMRDEFVIRNYPVVVLPGLDHSSFCPGFHVPGDVWPAEADNATALDLIGSTTAAFLSLFAHPTSISSLSPRADPPGSMTTLMDALVWTRQLLTPLITSFGVEVAPGAQGHQAPWCEISQQIITGLDDLDEERPLVARGRPLGLSSRVSVSSIYKEDSHEWEHTRVAYEVVNGSGRSVVSLKLNVTGHNDPETGFETCIMSTKQVGCKMLSADRVAQQLGLNATGFNGSKTCKDVNKHAVEVAISLLGRSEAGKKTLARFQQHGRPFCFLDDFEPFEKIGPLFVMGSMKYNDNGTCLQVASIAISNTVESSIFPGVHYCKVMSPARALDYISTDSLKPKSGCLNK